MSALTANDFAQQIIAQARVLDPSFSGEVGTPERKIIDTVAQALADNQIDLSALQGALDIDSKYGTNLDRFTALFGFQRQQAQPATGYVVFSRNTPAPAAVSIPTGITLQASVVLTNGLASNVQYVTTASGVIPISGTVSGAIPVQAVVSGTIGNVAANTIQTMVGTPVPGVTSVTNQVPLTTGIDGEDDNSYKVRFKNTVFRNLAGTQDQYLALAVGGAFTTKANVIGVQSRYREYIQIPSYDDAGYLNSSQTAIQDTFGTQGNFTTALSAIPYAKQIYTNTSVFVSNGQSGPAQYFYRQGIDFAFNLAVASLGLASFAAITGDTLRNQPVATTGGSQGAGTTINVTSTAGFPTSGQLITRWSTGNGPAVLISSYTGKTATSFTGVTGGLGTLPANSRLYLVPTNVVQPNFTFFNVWNSGSSPAAGLQALSPGSLVLAEYSYISSASRNDAVHNVTNAVDVYVDGSNPVQGSTIFVPRWIGIDQFVTSNPGQSFFVENFRRDGEPARRPQVGNYITPLFNSPLVGLPSSITVGSNTYYEGWHYWLVHEIGQQGGSIRARDGIEWNPTLPGDPGGQAPPAATQELTPLPYYPTGGSTIVAACGTQNNLIGGSTPLAVNNYLFDANVPSLQATMEDARQVTTDVLVHSATTRYFKLDITVMYSPGANYTAVNASIATAVQAFFQRQYFGTVIQLSDLLDVVHQVPGVDNVRWSNDLPTNVGDLIRVAETDINGVPLHGAFVERLIYGTPLSGETQTLYVVGMQSVPPFVGTDTDSFILSWRDPALSPTNMTTAAIPFFDTNGNPLGSVNYQGIGGALAIQNAIQAVDPSLGQVNNIYTNITVTQDTRPIGYPNPITSFTLTYATPASSTGSPLHPYLPVVTNNILASQFTYDSDFFLLDNELPSLPTGMISGDTLPGLIIRPRAQNTWNRPGLT